MLIQIILQRNIRIEVQKWAIIGENSAISRDSLFWIGQFIGRESASQQLIHPSALSLEAEVQQHDFLTT
jgi:hypothetical protein